ncbi:HlyD family type I secretion periplasmic adaptor subunit [Methylothermus subterraneus]
MNDKSLANVESVLPAPAEELRRFVRLGLWLLLAGFGGFLAWAALAPLDSGVPAPGVAVVESKRKTVAHLEGGIVKQIHVTEAQYVEAGQPLITLDDTLVAANFQSALKEYYALLARRARLEAERLGKSQIDFAEELIQAGSEGDAAAQIAAQQQLFLARRSALESAIRVLSAQAQTYLAEARSKATQLEFLSEQLAGMRALAAEGYAPRNEQYDLERQTLELRNHIDLAERQAKETELKLKQIREDYRKEVETELAEVVQRLSVVEEKVKALKDQLERTVIRAPVAGYVNGLQVHTVGGVIRPGEALMEIVPKDEPLLFEAKVPAQFIDRIHPGLAADIQLQAFLSWPQTIIEGKVISVSADLLSDPVDPRSQYYLARVEVTENGKQQLGKRSLQPGMAATIVIKTGEQTLLQYLMRPLLRRLHTALTEE